MRLSSPLYKQNIGWHFKVFWERQGLRKIQNTGLEKKLLEKGIPVIRAEEVRRPPHQYVDLHIVGLKPKPMLFDKTHPNWRDKVLLTYKDNNVLLQGLAQAKILTNSVELTQGLPEGLVLETTKKIDRRVKQIILASNVYDGEQVKLPKIKDPNRPAFNFPRVYGISQSRAIKLLLHNLLRMIENSCDLNVVKQRHIIEDGHFCYNFDRFGESIQFELTGDTLITTSKPLGPVTTASTDGFILPDLDPIKPTVTLNRENIYEIREIYPINLKFPKSYPHTIFIPLVDTEVKNLYEEPVTESQIHGRSLLKTFTVAASFAREKYGGNVKLLPEPVTVQCVQTNGKLFHFGVFQLNTLDLGDERVRNIWYQTDRIPLFEECCYKVGRPVLEGYNSDVVKYMNAFYNNV